MYESGFDDDDYETATVNCSNCGASVYEDSPRCPECGDYLVGTTVSGQRSWLFIVIAVIIIALFALGSFAPW